MNEIKLTPYCLHRQGYDTCYDVWGDKDCDCRFVQDEGSLTWLQCRGHEEFTSGISQLDAEINVGFYKELVEAKALINSLQSMMESTPPVKMLQKIKESGLGY